MRAQGFEAPILVGGGAVELYSNSAITTGDFDLVTGRADALDEILRELGFVRPYGAEVGMRGWLHPELKLAFEVVSGALLDGLADRERILLVDLGEDGIAAVISVEDMIADRMGQFASGSAPEMREQARRLVALHSDADRAYLDARIRQETTGEFGIEDL